MNRKQSHRGINSFIQEVKTTEGNRIIYKKYKDNNNKERIKREIEFLQELQRKNLKNVPTLLDSNQEEGWVTMTHIAGEKISALDKAGVLAITNFLKQINKDKYSGKIGYAKDAYLSKHHVTRDIRRRIQNYRGSKKSVLSCNFNKWVKSEVITKAQSELRMIERTNFWEVQKKDLILSPSDLGIHNMLKMQDTYYFIDFEYAGLDNPNKTILDIICQPNHNIKKETGNYIIQEMRDLVNSKEDSWRSELNRMKEIIMTKWCFIMMNNIKEVNQEKEESIMQYYSRVNKLFN